MTRLLRELAASYSLLNAYTDAAGKRQVASAEALLGVLRAMGVDIGSAEDAERALNARKEELARRVVEPVIVAWNGRLRLPPELRDESCEVELEGGNTVAPQRRLPLGYHNLRVRIAGSEHRSRILSAPKKCYSPPDAKPSWGVFLPIYALSSRRSLGCGDFTDFEELTRLVEMHGGSVVATLPLLATFLDPDGPFEPSPYAPASRLFWNEFYVDLTKIPELEQSSAGREMLESDEVRKEIAELLRQPYVNYRRQMALKRKILEDLAETFFQQGTEARREEFAEFIRIRPDAEDYARFRATTERQQKGWPVWDGSDFHPAAARYHLYAQWITHQQLAHLAEKARQGGRGLYLDFPLGVHPDGYDIWREREAFALNVSVGAPPDPFFTKGQSWGFPPLHPDRIREQKYDYLIRVLRHHMEHAGILRLDHVMALHRLYWIPSGIDATAGVYVRYRPEELYAIISIESHRHRTTIVGEDLGTVPGYVRTAMSRHDLRRMYVLQYEATPDSRSPVAAVIPRSIASLNTHDMPPFSAYWHAADVSSRIEMGLLDDEQARQALESRARTRQNLAGFLRKRGLLNGNTEDPVAVHDACMTYLSRSDAEVVLVSLEDLWLEKEPQNVPGTSAEKPNWRRKARKTLEEIRSSPSITLRLKTIDSQRRRSDE